MAFSINAIIVLISIMVVELGHRAFFSDSGIDWSVYNLSFVVHLVIGSMLYAFMYNKASYLWRPHVNQGFIRAKETTKVPNGKMTGIKVFNGIILGLIGFSINRFFFNPIMFGGGGGSDSGDSPGTVTTILVAAAVLTASAIEWKGRTEDDGDG